MKKLNFNTEKFYYGFPVYLLGYKDSNYGYNFSTMSSSYTLGDMVVVGMFKYGNALKEIRKHKSFTINLPTKSQLEAIEVGAKNSGKDKFNIIEHLEYTISNKVNAPIIKQSMVTIECAVISINEPDEFENFVNITAKIKGRLINSNLLKDGKIDENLFSPVIFMADQYNRFFHFLGDEIIKFK